MTEVVREAGGVDEVGAATQGLAQLAADLGHSREWVSRLRTSRRRLGCDHLRLGGQAAAGCGADEPGPVSCGVVTVGTPGGRVLTNPALPVDVRVTHVPSLGLRSAGCLGSPL